MDRDRKRPAIGFGGYMQLVRVVALGAVLAMLAVGAVACGDDADDGGDEPRATSTTGSAPQATSTTGSGAAASPTAGPGGEGGDEVSITAADFSFSPAALTISGASDTRIKLDNTGNLPHTIHIYYDEGYTDALADTGSVSAGMSGEVTVESNSVEAAPQLFFRCNIHPQQMKGTITVE